MPRKSKENTTKKEEAPDSNRRRSARLAAVEPKTKVKDESPVKTPKRQAAKRASNEVKKTMVEEENVNSNIESTPSVEKIDQDGDKIAVDVKDEVDAKKSKVEDEDTTSKKSKEAADEESSELIIDTVNEKKETVEESNVEDKAEGEEKGNLVSFCITNDLPRTKGGDESGKDSDQNHVNNNIETIDKV